MGTSCIVQNVLATLTDWEISVYPDTRVFIPNQVPHRLLSDSQTGQAPWDGQSSSDQTHRLEEGHRPGFPAGIFLICSAATHDWALFYSQSAAIRDQYTVDHSGRQSKCLAELIHSHHVTDPQTLT